MGDGCGMKRQENLFIKGMNNNDINKWDLFRISSNRNRTLNDKRLKTNDKLKIDIRTGIIHYRKQSRPFQKIVKTKDNHTISLVDVIR